MKKKKSIFLHASESVCQVKISKLAHYLMYPLTAAPIFLGVMNISLNVVIKLL